MSSNGQSGGGEQESGILLSLVEAEGMRGWEAEHLGTEPSYQVRPASVRLSTLVRR